MAFLPRLFNKPKAVISLIALFPLLLSSNARAGSLGLSTSPGSFADTRSQTSSVSPYLVNEDTYILGPGDSLQLRFIAAQELNTKITILNDGTATLPLIGSVRLLGLTIPQANLWLSSLYKPQLVRPDLQLTVETPRPLRVAVVGEVEKPGLYTLSTSETSQTGATVSISGLPTVVDAIQKAGGITVNANLSNVILQRRLPGDQVRYKRARVDLLTLIRQGDQVQNPLLFDGDTIRVTKAPEPVGEAVELSSTTLAPKEITVYVVGEVKNPGPVTLAANTPLLQAVLAAGGVVNWRASRGNIELVRINRNGSALRQRFTVDFNQGASNQKNPPLRAGDSVIVNRSGYAVASDALGAIANPMANLINIWSLYRLINPVN